MKRHTLWTVTILVIVGLSLSACAQGVSAVGARKSAPAKVEKIAGTDLSRVILSEKAAVRLGIVTAPVVDAPAAGVQRSTIPYGAVLYDARGDTWAYTNPEPLVYVRHRINVDSIAGDRAILSAGPPVGTAVVIVGAIELFGAEMGVGY